MEISEITLCVIQLLWGHTEDYKVIANEVSASDIKARKTRPQEQQPQVRSPIFFQQQLGWKIYLRR